MYQPFRAAWQRVIRPSTSFPPPPLRFRTAGFPQYGSKRACQMSPSAMRPRRVIDILRPVRRSPTYCSVHWACAPSERAERRLRPTRPVALGSASGYAVHQPHRLLWPHPSFCTAPPVSYMADGSRGPEGPHFYLPELDDVPPSILRWFQGVAYESKLPAWPSPIW